MRKPRLKRIKLSTATNAYDLLNDVCTAVLDEPRRIDMGSWFRKVLTKTFRPSSGRKEKRRTYVSAPACGTVGCIAGWIQTLKIPAFNPGESMLANVSYPAQERLCERYNELMWGHIYALFHGTALNTVGDNANNGKTLYPFPNHRVGTKAYARDVVANIRAFQARFETQLRERKVA